MYRKNSILESARKNPPPVDKDRGLETVLLILIYLSGGKIDAHQIASHNDSAAKSFPYFIQEALIRLFVRSADRR